MQLELKPFRAGIWRINLLFILYFPHVHQTYLTIWTCENISSYLWDRTCDLKFAKFENKNMFTIVLILLNLSMFTCDSFSWFLLEPIMIQKNENGSNRLKSYASATAFTYNKFPCSPIYHSPHRGAPMFCQSALIPRISLVFRSLLQFFYFFFKNFGFVISVTSNVVT